MILTILIGTAVSVLLGYGFARLVDEDKTVCAIVGGIIGFIAFLIFAPIFFGVHWNTGTGEHSGYVTAVEKSGLFFKTYTAHFKTDNQSSQEDQYCVIDSELVEKLKTASENRNRIALHYFSWLSAGAKNCGGEGAVADSFKVLN